MPRWRQVYNEETGKHELVPIDDAARARDGVAIHGPMEPFVSPIDGTVISGRKAYRDHCKKHGVVPAQEFSDEFYARKAEERRRHYQNDHDREVVRERRMAINEIINHLERAR